MAESDTKPKRIPYPELDRKGKIDRLTDIQIKHLQGKRPKSYSHDEILERTRPRTMEDFGEKEAAREERRGERKASRAAKAVDRKAAGKQPIGQLIKHKILPKLRGTLERMGGKGGSEGFTPIMTQMPQQNASTGLTDAFKKKQ